MQKTNHTRAKDMLREVVVARAALLKIFMHNLHYGRNKLRDCVPEKACKWCNSKGNNFQKKHVCN